MDLECRREIWVEYTDMKIINIQFNQNHKNECDQQEGGRLNNITSLNISNLPEYNLPEYLKILIHI